MSNADFFHDERLRSRQEEAYLIRRIGDFAHSSGSQQ